jgi:hypothetical protein
MKNSSLILFALTLMPAVSRAQSLPDDPAAHPAPAQSTSNPQQALPLSDAVWTRIQQFANGQEILLTNTYGPPLRCRFAGATDAFLFCDPPGSPAGAGYRFERASVLDVKLVKAPRNWHPGMLSAMIGGGLVVGIAAAAQTDAGHAAQAGLIGALVTGAIAAPLVFLQPQPLGAGWGAGIAFRPRGFAHRPHLFLPIRR